MSNQFNIVKDNMASSRFMLVRMSMRKYYIYTSFTPPAGNLYRIDETNIYNFFQVISGVKQQFTQVYDGPNAHGEWQNYTDHIIFYTTTIPIFNGVYENFVMYDKYLYMTGCSYSYAHSDPFALTGDIVEWLPVIQPFPSISHSLENIINGIISTQLSSLTCLNTNNYFNKYIGYNASFNGSECKIWLCIDSVDNVKLIYNGYVTGFSIDRSKINFKVEDYFSILNQPATLNDAVEYTYINRISNTNLYPNTQNIPLRIVFGMWTKYKLITDNTSTGLTGASMLDPTSLMTAYCTNYSTTISTSNNRDYLAYRTYSTVNTLDEITLGDSINIANVDNAAPGYTKFSIAKSVLVYSKAPFGDVYLHGTTTGSTIRINSSYYVRVLKVEYSGSLAYIYTTKNGSISNGHSFESYGLDAIVISQNGVNYYAMHQRDYTYSLAATSVANMYAVSFIFANNFEATLGMAALDPSRDDIKFRSRNNGVSYSRNIIAALITNAGLTQSGTAWESSTLYQAYLAIPDYDEGDYNTYSWYLQKLLKSSSLTLTLDALMEVGLKQIGQYGPTIYITQSDIIKGSFNIQTSYKDITTKAIIYNSTLIESRLSGYSELVVNEYIAENLHQIKNTDRLESVIDEAYIYNYLNNKETIYHFNLPYRFSDILIGDTINVEFESLLGEASIYPNKDLYVIGVEYSNNYIGIIATDLEF